MSKAALMAIWLMMALQGCSEPAAEPGSDRLPTPTASTSPTSSPPASPTPSPSPGESPSPGADARVVKVFFGSREASDCERVLPVERTTEGSDVLHDAIEALLEGPTAAERSEGLASSFGRRTRGMLISVRIDSGIARVDFRDFSERIPNASASCAALALLAQLDATATQFPTVREARYSFEGSERAFYHWLQMDVPA